MSGWAKAPDPLRGRPRRKGQGGHTQVLVDRRWIGERIALIHYAVEAGEPEHEVAKRLGVDNTKVRDALVRWAEVMSEEVEKEPPPAPVAVDVANDGPPATERSTWVPLSERTPEQQREDLYAMGMESGSMPSDETPEEEPMPAPLAPVSSEPSSEASGNKQNGLSVVTDEPSTDDAPSVPDQFLPMAEARVLELQVDGEYDRGFAIGYMAGVLAVIAADRQATAAMAATKALELLERAP